MAFVHLHNHTEYSLLDGACRIEDLCAAAKDAGMTSLAITDHGVMYGAVEFYKECHKAGLKPIIGCEVYVAADRHSRTEKNYAHLLLLVKNEEGYQNLIKLVSASFTEGFYYKPRIDYDLLESFSGGLVCLSACLAGDIPQFLLNGRFEEAKVLALRLKNMFPGDFYIELQDHGIPEQKQILPLLIKLARECELPLAATNDIHYVHRSDAGAHDVLLCIQTGKTLDDPDRMRFQTEEFYLKTEDEMRTLFSYVPDAVDNTALIAEKCNFDFTFGNIHIPYYEVPDGLTAEEYLWKLGQEGLEKKYSVLTEEIRRRFQYEFDMIRRMGYVEYYLIVWDYINFAKNNHIVVGPGRGSGAGSLVAYAIGITQLDPLKYNLLFERFLNPERVSMPDFDVDFCYERRGEVIDYVKRKYGEDHVAQIVTFGTLKAKAVIRDVGRVMNFPYADTDRIAKMIPNELGVTLNRALEVNPELREACKDEKVAQLVEMAKRLEGLPRNASTHAAGVVISRDPVDTYVPLCLNGEMVATQYIAKYLEQLGLLKMDFLGLRTLTVIRDALEFIRKSCGKEIDLYSLGFDDPAVYRMLGAGDCDGVFQLESNGMRSFMKELKPSCFEDIVAGIALYRPGPMSSIPKYIEGKNNPEAVEYQHPVMKNALAVTYGCMVYQEQVMQVVRDVAGYSLGRSDIMRRAMSKKDKKAMDFERGVFIYGLEEDGKVIVEGAVRRGIPEETAIAIFDKISTFAQYAFNKSHAAVYAVVAYQTAYLKYYYPMEFMAAMLNSLLGDSAQTARYIGYCRDHSIAVLPPDVNTSFSGFAPVDGKTIRFGLSAVKNVGISATQALVDEREKNGPYKSLEDYAKRTASLQEVNKRMTESLIRAGAFAFTGYSRKTLLANFEAVLDNAAQDAKSTVAGQFSMFDAPGVTVQGPVIRDIGEFPQQQLLAMEKEMLGVYLSGHPLDRYRKQIQSTGFDFSAVQVDENDGEDGEAGDAGISEEILALDNKDVSCICIISAIRKKATKNGSMMAFLTLEDLYGSMTALVFPTVLARASGLIFEDSIVRIRGKLSVRDEEQPTLLVNDVHPVKEDAEKKNGCGAEIYIRVTNGNKEHIGYLKGLQKMLPGTDMLILYYPEQRMKQALADGICLAEEAEAELKRLFGEENVKIKKQ